MNKINFNLVRPVRITPLSGENSVEVSGEGKCLIVEMQASKEKRQRNVVLAKTKTATLSRSPKGVHKILTVTMDLTDATDEALLTAVTQVLMLAHRNEAESL